MSLGSTPILLIGCRTDEVTATFGLPAGSSRLGDVVPDWKTAPTPATRRMFLPPSPPAGELRDFEQDLRQAVGHVDHDVVAARHLVDTPAGGSFELVASGVERRIRIADSENVGLLGDAIARAGQGGLVGEGSA